MAGNDLAAHVRLKTEGAPPEEAPEYPVAMVKELGHPVTFIPMKPGRTILARDVEGLAMNHEGNLLLAVSGPYTVVEVDL